MNPNLADFQRRFPATQWQAFGATWTLRDTDQDATRIPLVLLPGAGGTGDTFYRAIDGLRGGRRIVSVSYPAVDDVNDLVTGLLDVLSKAGIQVFDLFGSSLGGYLAQMCVIREPARVRRCMFGNTFYDPSWLQQKVSRDGLLNKPASEHLQGALNQLNAAPEDTAERADYKRTMLHLVGADQTAEMAKAALLAVLGATPLLKADVPAARLAILDAEDDPVVDAPTRQAMRERYSASSQFHLTTGGHYPALLNPEAFQAALMAHFRSE